MPSRLGVRCQDRGASADGTFGPGRRGSPRSSLSSGGAPMFRSPGRLAVLFLLMALLLAACAAGPNVAAAAPAGDAGFWLGLWHGIITPITFVISLFTDRVSIYEVRNDGNWYDFGYVLGLMVAFGGAAGSGGAAGRRATRGAGRRRR